MQDPLRLGNRVGLGTLERSADYYTRALQTDPTFVPAALSLAQVTLALLDTARLREARDVLRGVVQQLSSSPHDLLLALGRMERSAGALQESAMVFERYLLAGGDRGLGLLELARTRLALGRADGEGAYYEGALLDDPAIVAEYRADLEIVASPADLREFDRLRGPTRAAYLHRFWTERDHWELRPEGERLREHYRRLLFARTHFPLTISRRFYGPQDAYHSGNNELDDRGIIYVRHGEPADRLRPFVFGVMPNESWRYVRAEGDLLFHFSGGYDEYGGGDLYDYRLVQSVFDLRGAADAPRDQLLLSRQSLSPVYSRMLNWGRFGAAKPERPGAHHRTDQHRGGHHDGHLRASLQTPAGGCGGPDCGRKGCGGEPGPSGLRNSRVRHLGPAESPRVFGYEVRVRLVALGASRQLRRHTGHDRRHQPSEGALHRNEYLVGRAQLALPPGRWRYRAALQQGDSAGVVLPIGSVRVAATTGAALALSDIALGTHGRAVSWVTDAADTVSAGAIGALQEGDGDRDLL